MIFNNFYNVFLLMYFYEEFFIGFIIDLVEGNRVMGVYNYIIVSDMFENIEIVIVNIKILIFF